MEQEGEVLSRLGRIEGRLEEYTTAVTKVLDRHEDTLKSQQSRIGSVEKKQARTAGIVLTLATLTSGAVVFVKEFFSRG